MQWVSRLSVLEPGAGQSPLGPADPVAIVSTLPLTSGADPCAAASGFPLGSASEDPGRGGGSGAKTGRSVYSPGSLRVGSPRAAEPLHQENPKVFLSGGHARVTLLLQVPIPTLALTLYP